MKKKETKHAVADKTTQDEHCTDKEIALEEKLF